MVKDPQTFLLVRMAAFATLDAVPAKCVTHGIKWPPKTAYLGREAGAFKRDFLLC